MKQIALFSVALLALVFHTTAQTKHSELLTGNRVSEATKIQFAKDYPGHQAMHWERKPDYDRVIFLLNGEHTTAYYNAHSKLVGTIVDKLFSALPTNAQVDIVYKYPDYTAEAVIFYDDNEDEPGGLVLASQDFDDWDYYFVKMKHKGDNREIMLKVDMSGNVSLFNKQAN